MMLVAVLGLSGVAPGAGAKAAHGMETTTGAAAAELRLTGVEYRSAREPASGYDSRREKTAIAYCPPGKQGVGGGVELVGNVGFGRVMLTHAVPSTAGYEAIGHEQYGGHSGDWAIQVWAICADFQPALGLDLHVVSGDDTPYVIPPRQRVNDA